MLDSDLVRIDLLRLKRKLYNSYPEGSVERQTFLMASKLSEIGYLSNVVPPDVVNFVFDEYKFKIKQEIIDILVNFGMGVSLGLLLAGVHGIYPKNSFMWFFWFLPSLLFLANGIRHTYRLIACWWSMRGFRKEYKVINDQIKKLSNEVKRIGDGK
jgi:hypothetical protein